MSYIVKIRGFTYYKTVPHPSNPKEEIIQAAFASRGEELDDLSDADVERGERLDAFFTEDELNTKDDEAVELGIIVVDASDDELDEYLENEDPNVKETIALAQGDPESAQRLLDAEVRTSGNDPRTGVVNGLEKIIEA